MVVFLRLLVEVVVVVGDVVVLLRLDLLRLDRRRLSGAVVVVVVVLLRPLRLRLSGVVVVVVVVLLRPLRLRLSGVVVVAVVAVELVVVVVLVDVVIEVVDAVTGSLHVSPRQPSEHSQTHFEPPSSEVARNACALQCFPREHFTHRMASTTLSLQPHCFITKPDKHFPAGAVGPCSPGLPVSMLTATA